jgi:hypothetical protein
MTRRALLTASLLLLAAGDLVVGQEPTNQLLRDTRQHDRVLVPVLEVREFSGEFERWGREMTVDAPKAEVFRWSTPVSGTASATWTLLDGPPGSGAAVVGSGSAGSAPREGSVTVFRIDFRKFFPSGLPAGGTTYWVVLEPVDAVGQAGSMSMPVQVTYANQAGQADPAAFAGREGDIVAPTQIALSKTSKLLFLQDLVAKSVELLGEDSDALATAAETGDVPDAQARLTPREGVSFDATPAAVSGGTPHWLEFSEPWVARSWGPNRPDGHVTFRDGTGRAAINLSLEPGQFYLLDISVWMEDPEGTFFLRSYGCQIDFEGSVGEFSTKDFPVTWGDHHLLAMVGDPSFDPSETACRFWLGSDAVEWAFQSAELSKLTKD